jgi:hypothetical protein
LTTRKKIALNNPLRQVIKNLGSAALTMYAAPHTVHAGVYQTAADDFAFRFTNSFPQVPIFRDYYTAQTNLRTEHLISRPFGQPSRYVFLRAAKETDVEDYGIISNMVVPTFSDLPVPVLTYDGKNAAALGKQLGGRDLGIIVVTAHSEDSLRKMVYDLGDAGTFAGNIVIFVSCRTPLTRELTEYMGGKGVNGVVVADRAITFDDAAKLFTRLHEKFKQPDSAKMLFRNVIREVFSTIVNVISVSQHQHTGGATSG